MSREFELSEREQRKWEAQERAVSEERSRAPSTGGRACVGVSSAFSRRP